MSKATRSESGEYERAVLRWRCTGRIRIETSLGTEIAVFPLSFVESCGINTWSFILDVVRQLVEQVPGGQNAIVDGIGRPVDLGQAPYPGTFIYKDTGTSPKPNSPLRFPFFRCRTTWM